MACSNCNTPSCGCSGTYVVSQTCPPACSEVFNSSCIVYTGVDISCLNDVTGISQTVISRNDYLDSALTKIVNFFCGRVNEALTSTIVTTTSAPYLSVTPSVSGAVTTFTVDLDVSSLPTASVVTGGANAVVTGTGAALDPYVVNANESVVAVDAASALTLVVDPSTPGPYETTYTIGVDASLLPDTVLQTSFGHISITEIPNTPNAGDTTYTLEVDEVTLTSIDPKLDVVLTNAGGIAPFERTFTVDVNDTLMGEFIMDTAGANIVAAGGITVAYDAIAHQITIGETIGVPDQWKIISDGSTDITAGSPTDKLRIVSGTGASVALASGPGANEASFTVTNTDLGSDQLIFGSVDCNNGGPSVGTCSASTNTDALTIVGGDDITLGVAGNTITINNDIDNVYSDVIADSGGSLQAATTTATLELLGGTGISTVGAAGPTNSVTINNDGVLSVASADANLTVATVAGACTITNAAPDQVVAITGGTNINVTGTYPSFTVDAAAGTATAVMAESIVKDATMASTGSGGTISVAGLTGKTYVQVRVIALAASGAFVAGQDATSDFKIGLTAASVSLTSTTYTGDIKVIIVG